MRRAVTGLKHYSSQTYTVTTQLIFHGRMSLPPLLSASSASHRFPPCLCVLIFPLLCCTCAPGPLGVPQLPAGGAQQQLGISGWQPQERFGFPGSGTISWTTKAPSYLYLLWI